MSLQTSINCGWRGLSKGKYSSEEFLDLSVSDDIKTNYSQSLLANFTNLKIYFIANLVSLNLYAKNGPIKVSFKLIFCAMSIRKFVPLRWALKLLLMGNYFLVEGNYR